MIDVTIMYKILAIVTNPVQCNIAILRIDDRGNKINKITDQSVIYMYNISVDGFHQ